MISHREQTYERLNNEHYSPACRTCLPRESSRTEGCSTTCPIPRSGSQSDSSRASVMAHRLLVAELTPRIGGSKQNRVEAVVASFF